MTHHADKDQQDDFKPLHPQQLTWAVLLGRWIDFSKSALALPDNDDGRRMRAAVPDIIMLQAVWFALQHLDELNGDQRALGLDRAEVLIDKHETALARHWPHAQTPALIQELIDDARNALRAAQEAST